MDKPKKAESTFSIAVVEREVGLSKDVLRVWERRYGFPTPGRDASGERLYPAEQVRRLALVKRLMDVGHRPGRLLELPYEALQSLAGAAADAPSSRTQLAPADLAGLMQLVRERDPQRLSEALQQRLAREGLQQFVQDTIAPAAFQVGLDWADGELQIHEEHLFTETVLRVLRQAVSQLPRGRAPVVLLTTVPDEPHGLGLMMLECLLALQGARCINLGTQMPLLEIARAARDHAVDIVALSFSSAFPARQVAPLVQQLRAALPPRQHLWAGGSGAARMGRVDGVQLLQQLDAAAAAVAQWPSPAEAAASRKSSASKAARP
ncbi:MerR family transcriptional regulator [Ramlibacter henchirensis]|uniref:MerR family transcriptional regulator n=1 Tax=Ramlibacter henchirensis TaxID=204072 RepID=A0A4Z0BQ58_9BURK|nr:MerR family transcriptional regulator [Ramlibacter henchirensis]TFZ00574.1 MerR family transcriptional regulator [Ramlibacter henchirensis]